MYRPRVLARVAKVDKQDEDQPSDLLAFVDHFLVPSAASNAQK